MNPAALIRLFTLGLGLLALCAACQPTSSPAPIADAPLPIRAAVIGGMTSTGLWQEVSARFTAATGIPVEIVATGDRSICAESFKRGEADLLTMHSGDITTNLVADGYGQNMRPWTRNDLVIVGPVEDPAGVRGLSDGSEALRRIAATRSPFLDFQGIGSREMVHNLWKRAGIPQPAGDWIIQDSNASDKWSALRLARERGAYLVTGRIPVEKGKMAADGMEILVRGDPFMRRPYIVMEADPRRFPAANVAGARALSAFLLADETQAFLATFGVVASGDLPFFHPIVTEPVPTISP